MVGTVARTPWPPTAAAGYRGAQAVSAAPPQEVDSREGLGFGQTVVDGYGGLKKPVNANWIAEGDAQGFFDLLAQRLSRLPGAAAPRR